MYTIRKYYKNFIHHKEYAIYKIFLEHTDVPFSCTCNSKPKYPWINLDVFYVFDGIFLSQVEKLYSHWIIPVIQGYVQMENCVLDFTQSSTSTLDLSPDYGNSRHLEPLEYQLGIISRRSIHRAGTSISV